MLWNALSLAPPPNVCQLSSQTPEASFHSGSSSFICHHQPLNPLLSIAPEPLIHATCKQILEALTWFSNSAAENKETELKSMAIKWGPECPLLLLPVHPYLPGVVFHHSIHAFPCIPLAPHAWTIVDPFLSWA